MRYYLDTKETSMRLIFTNSVIITYHVKEAVELLQQNHH